MASPNDFVSADRSSTSAEKPAASIPFSRNFAARSSRDFVRRAISATRNPSAPNLSATAKPMPGPAPTTAIVFAIYSSSLLPTKTKGCRSMTGWVKEPLYCHPCASTGDLQDFADDRTDRAGLAGRREDLQRSRRRCLHLLHGLLVLEREQRLPLHHGAAVGHQPFGNIALGHGEAQLRQNNLGTQGPTQVKVLRIAASMSAALYRKAVSSTLENGTGQSLAATRCTGA